MSMTATRVAMGKALKALGEVNEKVVVFDADVGAATQTKMFAQAFPDRFCPAYLLQVRIVNYRPAFRRLACLFPYSR